VSRIFISHSSEDGVQSARLLEWLHAQGFASTFLDFDEQRGIAPGADWERTLYRELSGADAVILVLTRNWFSSKWCFAEFAQARAYRAYKRSAVGRLFARWQPRRDRWQ
jgi:hypothetical protein